MGSEDRKSKRNDEVWNERDDDFEDSDDVVQDEWTTDLTDSTQPGASGFSPTESCACPGGKTLLLDVNAALCPLCGKPFDKTLEDATLNATTAADQSGATANGEVDAVTSLLVDGLVIVPSEASLEDEIFASTPENESINTDPPREERQAGIKIPVESDSRSSVPLPCPPLLLTYFVLKRDYRNVNEMSFSLHFVENSDQGRVLESVRHLEQQLGIPLHVVSLGEQHSTQVEHKHLHTLYVNDQIMVKFQLLRQCETRFTLQDQPPFQVPLIHIKSLCQDRIPTSVAQVHVTPNCQPGEVCQDHIKMTIDTGQTTHIMLIPIWSSLPANPGE
ncbi:uncharacterized protein LOC111336433 isoform X2 [Stylophora pistillata]|uniref:Uncharacterized protein n=1 Tax=Stylophora pistillata TaxID=50429 RepID=A0A2B4RQS3_STYPI|nr:uncharacterized protein LOC111336433 isoform X2 [Stylophora pistillata]XP_022798281.1 uncharacterized protein LOC111336433 isoform X2 [Stylophora pistillata]PFX20794.1 hypothetical protein AWC38_SpisGene14717 [Stylophora pistillata]